MINSNTWRNVGAHIRKVRRASGLTLKQLAVGCDLSPNAISLIERGEVAPTVITLCKIAHALGVPAGAFFQDVCPSEVVLTRADPSRVNPAEMAFQALTRAGSPMELPSDARRVCTTSAAGTQMVVCVCGSVEYEVDGQSYLLNPGDSLTFNAEAFHRWKNPGSSAAVAVMVLTPVAY
jgi:transcriptional regulator with XRE-family HTH domain